MAVKQYRPTTPARRGMTSQDWSSLQKGAKSPKSLRSNKRTKSGRNNQGKITVRHRGGGAKRFYRHVNFNLPEGVTAKIEAIEYDPNRSARIALVRDESGQYHYVIASSKMKVGQSISSGKDAKIKTGHRLKLKDIPTGTEIYNIELTVGRGGQMVRAAGASARLQAKEGKYAQVKLPSGEIRMINLECKAEIGSVGNEQHQNIKFGSAGRKRRQGWRPSVRGVVMNAVDHPHGGGDGGSHPPGRHPKTPWGQKTLGYKTRRQKRSTKMIVRTRHEAKRN